MTRASHCHRADGALHRHGHRNTAADALRLILLALIALAPLRAADEGISDQPGFRPAAEADAGQSFLAALPRARLTVLPGAVRTTDGVAYDPALSAALAAPLRAAQLSASVDLAGVVVALPPATSGQPQYAMFQQELAGLAEAVRGGDLDADYVLLVEYLVTPLRRGGEAVGGIHCFVLTRDGTNAFSFLLNTHHRLLVDANLRTTTVGGPARAELLTRAAGVAGEALIRQVAAARTR